MLQRNSSLLRLKLYRNVEIVEFPCREFHEKHYGWQLTWPTLQYWPQSHPNSNFKHPPDVIWNLFSSSQRLLRQHVIRFCKFLIQWLSIQHRFQSENFTFISDPLRIETIHLMLQALSQPDVCNNWNLSPSFSNVYSCCLTFIDQFNPEQLVIIGDCIVDFSRCPLEKKRLSYNGSGAWEFQKVGWRCRTLIVVQAHTRIITICSWRR